MTYREGTWRALPVTGTRKREWHIVNEAGGLIARAATVERRAKQLASAPELANALRDALNIIKVCGIKEPKSYPADCPYEPMTEGLHLNSARCVLATWEAL